MTPDHTTQAVGRPRRWRLAVLVALVIAIAAGVWLVVRDDRPRAVVGEETVVQDGDKLAGYTNVLALPFADLTLTVSDPVTERPPPCCTDEPVERRAPEGGSFVGVAAELPDDPTDRVELLASAPEPSDLTITLVVTPRDELGRDLEPQRYPVTSAVETTETDLSLPGRPVWVAIEGEPDVDEITVEVTLDDVTWSVDPRGGFVDRRDVPYLGDAAQRTATCGRPRVAEGLTVRGDIDQGCGLTYQRTAWISGLGWAEESSTWLVLTARVPTYASLLDEDGDPVSGPPTDALAVAPTDPARSDVRVVDGAFGVLAVLEVPDSLYDLPLTVSETYRVNGYDTLDVEYRWAVTV